MRAADNYFPYGGSTEYSTIIPRAVLQYGLWSRWHVCACLSATVLRMLSQIDKSCTQRTRCLFHDKIVPVLRFYFGGLNMAISDMRHFSSVASWHAPRIVKHAPLVMVDDFRDPAWQRDSILLLAYCGLEDLSRDAATGVKETIGLDFLQLNTELACALLVAFSWVGVAILTGVLGEQRYDRKRVLLTWLAAAPLAAVMRVIAFDGYVGSGAGVGRPEFAAFDAAATLGLQLFLRYAEEEGFV